MTIKSSVTANSCQFRVVILYSDKRVTGIRLDENGKPKIVRDEDFKKLKGEIEEEEEGQ